MGLLTDIYNTVAKFFRQQDEQEGDASKSVATNRLKLVLMQDRTNLTPKILEQMRGEMVDLLSKYLEMDKDLLELNFEQEGDQVALMLSIPVIRAKDEEEIEEAIKASKVAQDETDEEETESDSVENNDEETIEESVSDEEELVENTAEEVEDVNNDGVLESDNQNTETDESDDEIVPKRKRTKKTSASEVKKEESQEPEIVSEG